VVVRVIYAILVYVAVIVAIVFGASSVAHADTWVSLGGVSHHFERSTPHNEENYGIGLEQDTSVAHLRLIVGEYKNSFWRESFYAGFSYTPLSLGPVRFGLMGAALTGYGNMTCETHQSGPTATASPMTTTTTSCAYHERVRAYGVPFAQIEGERFGVNMLAAPPIAGKGGVVAVQFKVKF